MEQEQQAEQQVYYPRHESHIVHQPFDPQRDVDLYINLENLPPGTPMMTFGNDYRDPIDAGIEIPVFIGGPMWVLLEIIEEGGIHPTDDLINDLNSSLIYDPTPYEPQCTVCVLVRWLLTQCQHYGECLHLCRLRQIMIFEIMREIWCRLRPKPLAFSGRHLDQASRIKYLILPMHNMYPLPLFPFAPPAVLPWVQGGRLVSLEWTYGFMFLIHEDIVSAGELAPISRFLFANLIRILRAYINAKLPFVPGATNSRLYILDAIWLNSGIALEVVMKLAKTIFLTLAELEGDWIPHPTPPPPGFRRENSIWYRKRMQRIVDNLLAMNVAELFYNGANPENFYQHSINCATSPQLCPCRYARHLAATL